MRSPFLRPRAPAWWLAAAVLAGCGAPDGGEPGGPDGGPRLPVRGTVTNGGRPVPNGEVMFFAETAEGRPLAGRGVIQPTGSYALDADGAPGVPAGRYRVVVIPDDSKEPGAQIDAPYLSADTTPLRVAVRDGAPPGSYDLKVTPPRRPR